MAEVNVLFWSKTVEIANDHSQHRLEQRKASLIADDSLGNAFVSQSWPNGLQGDAVGEVRQQILDYPDKTECLDVRVEAKQALQLGLRAREGGLSSAGMFAALCGRLG